MMLEDGTYDPSRYDEPDIGKLDPDLEKDTANWAYFESVHDDSTCSGGTSIADSSDFVDLTELDSWPEIELSYADSLYVDYDGAPLLPGDLLVYKVGASQRPKQQIIEKDIDALTKDDLKK